MMISNIDLAFLAAHQNINYSLSKRENGIFLIFNKFQNTVLVGLSEYPCPNWLPN